MEDSKWMKEHMDIMTCVYNVIHTKNATWFTVAKIPVFLCAHFFNHDKSHIFQLSNMPFIMFICSMCGIYPYLGT